MGSKISVISYYLPEKTFTNEDFYLEFPESKGTSLEKTGIYKRHIIAPDETASDMAFKAAEKLFSEHQIDPQSIDFLILACIEPDYYTPPTSAVLHGRLGLKPACGIMEYNHGCSAYVYGLGMADGAITRMGAKRVLFLTTSSLTHTFHPGDKSSRFVFGDAATATLLEDSDTEDIGPYEYGTNGNGYNRIIVEDGHARNAITEESLMEIKDDFGNITSRATFRMDGTGVFLFTMKTVPAMIEELLKKAALKIEDVDYFVFHQPNEFLNEMLRKKIGIPEEKFIHCIRETGNTVQCTIPIALCEMYAEGKLTRGTTVVLAGFGVGLSWISTVAKF